MLKWSCQSIFSLSCFFFLINCWSRCSCLGCVATVCAISTVCFFSYSDQPITHIHNLFLPFFSLSYFIFFLLVCPQIFTPIFRICYYLSGTHPQFVFLENGCVTCTYFSTTKRRTKRSPIKEQTTEAKRRAVLRGKGGCCEGKGEGTGHRRLARLSSCIFRWHVGGGGGGVGAGPGGEGQ